MYKRMTACFGLLMVLICFATMQIFSVGTNEAYKQAEEKQSRKSETVAVSRGMIYDCNMQPLVNRSYEQIKGVDAVMRYDINQTASHIIGYVDSDNKGVSGIEAAYDELLTSCGGSASLEYKVDAAGNVISGSETSVKYDNYVSPGGVILTLDSRIQAICGEVLEKYGRPAAAVVSEVKTGKIRAVASYPEIDNRNPANSLNSEDTPFLNRALCSYNLGSVFKLCVAAAALEDGKSPEQVYECVGSITVEGNKFSCSDGTSHGMEDMRTALEKSCNTYFIDLALKIDKDLLLETAKKFGFSEATRLCDGISGESGSLPTSNQLLNKISLSSFAFGQSELMATPLQVSQMINTIANGGKRCELTLIEGMVDALRNVTLYEQPKPIKAISAKTASMLSNYMISVAEEGTGKSGLPEIGGAGAKTATAETGIVEDGKNILITWYAGFISANNPKYSIVIMVEDGKSGGETCGPLFKEIADKINSIEN